MQCLNHNDTNSVARLHQLEPDRENEAIARAVRAELEPIIAELRRFIDRRVAEISAELHATTELMSFTEEALFGRLADIQHKLTAMLPAVPDHTAD